MLFLLFNLGEDICAIDADSVVEVLPLVDIKTTRHAPRGVVGTFNYRGAFVPVIDLSELAIGRPAPARLSTRIILVRYVEAGQMHLLGLIAENTTETLRCDPGAFVPPGITTERAPYLGPIARTVRGTVQRIEVDKLMPDFMLRQSA